MAVRGAGGGCRGVGAHRNLQGNTMRREGLASGHACPTLSRQADTHRGVAVELADAPNRRRRHDAEALVADRVKHHEAREVLPCDGTRLWRGRRRQQPCLPQLLHRPYA